MSSRASVSCVLKYWRANVPCVLTCSRANVSWMSTCSHPHALRALRAHVPTWLACFACLQSHVLWLNITKISFQTHFLAIVLCFFLWKKNCWTFLHFYYQSQAFNECYDKLSKIKWLAFCLNITFRVISKRFIEGERWIIMYESLRIYKKRFKHLAIAAYFFNLVT